MHKEIKHYLFVHSFDSQTRWGTINEGENLRKALQQHNNDESKFLKDIDIYSIHASNGTVTISKKETRTFLNVGKFSFYYHNDCYESTIFDANGEPTGGSYWITERTINEPDIHCYNGKASGNLFIYADYSDEEKQRIIERAKREVLWQCREKFGRW